MKTMRLIDADALIDWIESMQPKYGVSAMSTLTGIVDRMPTVGAEPVRHGHWVKKRAIHGGIRKYTGTDELGNTHTITVDERMEYDDLYCSECDGRSADSWLNFCPKCGAKMDAT
jgi:hypothetical protein